MTSRQTGIAGLAIVSAGLILHGLGYDLTTGVGWRMLTDFLPPVLPMNFMTFVFGVFFGSIALILAVAPRE